MKCKKCDTEMMIDSVEENYSSETINYKCPNPNCCDYGYAERGDINEEPEI